jgi:anti-sigma-K factor RskA
MSEIKSGQPEDAELSPSETLLPWYATGRLSVEDLAKVEAALAADDELRRRLALVREEASETIGLNESLRTPSTAAMDRLMAKIDLHEAQHPRRAAFGQNILEWISDTLSRLSPRTLAWSAMAAAVVICLEGGLLMGLLAGRHEEAGFKTASVETEAEANGTYALISFVDTLPLQQLNAFLLEHHATLLEGPKPGGFYRVKIADQTLSGDALKAVVGAFRAQSKIVSIILPEVARP